MIFLSLTILLKLRSFFAQLFKIISTIYNLITLISKLIAFYLIINSGLDDTETKQFSFHLLEFLFHHSRANLKNN